VCEYDWKTILVVDGVQNIVVGNISHSVRVEGTANATVVILSVDNVPGFAVKYHSTMIGGIRVYVKDVFHYPGNQSISGGEFIFGENRFVCPADCSSQLHLSCENNACTIKQGAGEDTCSDPGLYCSMPPLPDLTITSFTVNLQNATNQTYKEVTLTAWIKNIGIAIAEELSTTQFHLPPFAPKNAVILSLAPGEVVTKEFNFDDVAPGTYTATVTADVYNNITESDETNNAMSINFTV
jgi:hypothetical protein